jgi:hypothetical protein
MKFPKKILATLISAGLSYSIAYAQTTPSQEPRSPIQPMVAPSDLSPPPPVIAPSESVPARPAPSPSDLAPPLAPANSPSSPTSPGAAIIKPTFQLLDSNHDGWISKSEAASVPNLTKDFDRYDLNRDGKLDRSEFDRYLR